MNNRLWILTLAMGGFFKTLKDKNQTDMQRKQAFHAVSIFYEIKVSADGKIATLNIKEEDISTGKTELRKTHR